MNNNECVYGIPNIQCPSCNSTLSMGGTKINKLSARQRKAYIDGSNMPADSYQQQTTRNFEEEDYPSKYAEHVYVIVTCDNPRCDQYGRFKSLELPRVNTPSIKVNL